MNYTCLQTEQIYDFRILPNPLKVGRQPLTPGDGYDVHHHPQAGSLRFRNLSFSHMHVVEMDWQSREPIVLRNQIPTDTVNFIFQLAGQNSVCFSGTKTPWQATAGQHGIYHQPDGDFYNLVRKDHHMNVLHISLDKEYFLDVIGSQGEWCDQVRRDVELRKPFTADCKPLPFLPAMNDLVAGIRNVKPSRPMHNLLLQSLVLELLALQIEQFQSTDVLLVPTSREDREKLYALKAYIDTDFLKDLSLAQLSRYCTLNEFKVKRGFKQLFGTTVFGYIRKKRMEYAAFLLARRGFSVNEVADVLGYEQPHNFSVAFKKYTGSYPSTVRSNV